MLCNLKFYSHRYEVMYLKNRESIEDLALLPLSPLLIKVILKKKLLCIYELLHAL